MGLEKEHTQANRDLAWAMHELNSTRIGCAIIEHDASMAKETR